MEYIYNKLVRNKIPKIIEKQGKYPVTRVLSDEEYKKALEEKLQEKHNEILESSSDKRVEKISDMFEILTALAKVEGSSFEEVLGKFYEKRRLKGTFDKKIFLEKVQ